MLIAFVKKDVEANQKLGWGIINDPDIVIKAKRYYALVILDANQYGILNEECSYNIPDILQEHLDKTVFIITNQGINGRWLPGEDLISIKRNNKNLIYDFDPNTIEKVILSDSTLKTINETPLLDWKKYDV